MAISCLIILAKPPNAADELEKVLLTTCATYNAKLANSDNTFPSNHDYRYSCKYSAYDQPHNHSHENDKSSK